jgi:MFS family permease
MTKLRPRGPQSQSAAVPRWYWLAYLTGGWGLAMSGMMSFLVPLRADQLGMSVGLIGLLLGVKGATEAVVSIPIGGLIDRIGPRASFLMGTSGAAIVGVIHVAATSIVALIVLQVALGVLRPLGWVGAQSYVSGLRDGVGAATDTGRLSFFATAAQIVAPLLMGFGAELFGLREAFYVFSLYCGLFFLLGVLLPRGSDSRSSGATERRGFVQGLGLFSRRGVRVVMLLSGARLWINVAWLSFFPIIMVSAGTSVSAAGAVISAMAVVGTLLSPTTGWLARRFRVEHICAFSLTCSAVGVAAAPALDTLPGAFASAFLVGIGQGMSLPTILVLLGLAVPLDQRGLALGLRASVNQTAAAGAPPAVALIIGLSAASVAFPVVAGLGSLLIVGALVTSRLNSS